MQRKRLILVSLLLLATASGLMAAALVRDSFGPLPAGVGMTEKRPADKATSSSETAVPGPFVSAGQVGTDEIKDVKDAGDGQLLATIPVSDVSGQTAGEAAGGQDKPAAADNGKGRPGDKDTTCKLIDIALKRGGDLRKLVKTTLQMGHDACSVIKCSIRSDRRLEDIIAGAYDASVPTDVVARCSLDAGADGIRVSEIMAGLSPNLCFLGPSVYGYTPGDAEAPIPPAPGPPGIVTRQVISPYTF